MRKIVHRASGRRVAVQNEDQQQNDLVLQLQVHEAGRERKRKIMNEIVMIPVAQLEHHPENPRKDLGDLTELAASIKANGIMQNLTVVQNGETLPFDVKRVYYLYDRRQQTYTFRSAGARHYDRIRHNGF